MATNRDELLKLKQNMRGNLQYSKSWDIKLYVKDFEDGLETMWRLYCSENI